jgi:hypothetical protein
LSGAGVFGNTVPQQIDLHRSQRLLYNLPRRETPH